MLKDLLDKGKCLMGMHQGDWVFDAPGRCTQTRVCTTCGVAAAQVEHRWSDWTYEDAGACEQARRCTRCAERETRTAHAWSPWEYSEPHRAPVRACGRCGERASRFARQIVDAADQGEERPATPTASSPAAAPAVASPDVSALLASGDTAALAAFVAACPGTPFTAQAIDAINTGFPPMQLLGLCMLADPYCRGQDPSLGLTIVRAVYTRSRELYAADADRNYLDTAAQASVTSLLALSALGEHDEAVRSGRGACEWLEREGHADRRAALLMSRIDAHLALGQFEEAGALLADAEAIDLPPEQFADARRLQDLRRTFDRLARQRATDLPQPAPADADTLAAGRADLAAQIEQLQAVMTGQEAESLQAVVGALAADARAAAPESQAAWAVQSQPLADALTEVLSGGAGGMTQLRNRNRTIKAALIFADPATARDRAAIERSLAVLLEARAWAKANACGHDEGTALWGLYLCYSRTERPDEAIEALQALRANLEAARRQIADPLERAGVMRDYPHLFPALCQLLCRAGRAGELLDAMEGAKGRVLSDVLAAGRADVTPGEPEAGSAAQLAMALQPLRAHFVSYFVDDEETYAAAVASDGSTHCTSIPIGRALLRTLAGSVDPKTWTRARGGLFGGPKPRPLPEQLAPLVAFLEPLIAAGTIKPGDHLCYCADDELHLVPLQYLPVMGQPLVRHVSVSRIHSAAALLALLDRPAERPTEFVAAQVPAQQDLQDAAKLASLARVSGWLGEHLSGRAIARDRATLAALDAIDLTGRLVHFATHGTFPLIDQPGRNPNPFHASGLAFAHDGTLPSLAEVAAGEADDMLLTPARVLTMDFGGSHVTLQACVSGLAKEGLGGDALGLELALLLAGARSLLATHWNIPAEASSAFSIGFYRRWLLDGCTRADAWRAAVLEIADARSAASIPGEYYWAGFSLSGDWR